MANAAPYEQTDEREFLRNLWLWDLHDTQTRWLLNDVSCALREFRTGHYGGNITIHIDDNGVPGRFAELQTRKTETSRARVLQKVRKMKER